MVSGNDLGNGREGRFDFLDSAESRRVAQLYYELGYTVKEIRDSTLWKREAALGNKATVAREREFKKLLTRPEFKEDPDGARTILVIENTEGRIRKAINLLGVDDPEAVDVFEGDTP